MLAAPLPMAHCSQSRLFCSISGLPLNEHNQPMMLPNGHVYGEQVSPKAPTVLSYHMTEKHIFKFHVCFPGVAANGF